MVIQGVIDGLESRYAAVKACLAGLTSDIANTPMTSLTATVDTATPPGAATTATASGTATKGGASLVTLDDATSLALVEGIVRALWPAAQATRIIADLAANGPTRLAKGWPAEDLARKWHGLRGSMIRAAVSPCQRLFHKCVRERTRSSLQAGNDLPPDKAVCRESAFDSNPVVGNPWGIPIPGPPEGATTLPAGLAA